MSKLRVHWKGMEEKSNEFVEKSAEVYAKV